MPDDFFTQTPPPAPKRRTSAKAVLISALIAFLLGAGGVGYAAWSGMLPFARQAPDPLLSAAPAPKAAPTTAAPIATASEVAAQDQVLDVAVSARLAALEQRIAQLDLRAEAASGNAARAEGLLVAFAARRALDRGAPLGYLDDQIKLRFADAQPNAVQTVIDAGRQPMTLEQLVTGLDALAPSLAKTPAANSAWATLKHEISGLFVVRHDSAPSAAPTDRLDRARLYLTAGKIDAAIGEVQRMPGAAGAANWIAAARRYDMARRALDLIETTALLETRNFKDAQGQRVQQPGLTVVPAAAVIN